MLKRIAIGLGLLVAVLLIALAAAYAVGSSKVDRVHDVQTARLAIAADSATVARGAHLVAINGCRDCHGEDLSGQVFADAPPFRIVASNLTPGKGGIGATYTPEDFDRAVRHGVKPDGRSVFVMPSAAYHQGISDADMAALIAYLQHLPPVDNALPQTEVRLLGRLLSAGPLDPAFEVNVEPARSEAPAPGATAEYGAYLAATCAYCHGPGLEGVERPPNPESPPAPSLAAAARWTPDEFKETLRTGITPSGKALDPTFMPWTFTAHMTDTELEALHAHVRTVTEQDLRANANG
jgi:mono/diheme cytochrome c family protein